MCTGLPEALQKGLQGEGAGCVSCVSRWMFSLGRSCLQGN